MTTNSSTIRRRLFRSAGFEILESRLVFSVESLAGVLDAELDQEADLTPVQISLTAAQQATGAQYVMNDYGFDGTGQTVAVIDSGIAWDHYALGGGYGAGYRVVGGWDFAEGDANPYDDGPAGFHGTHVAGIIGSHDANNRGVASGADLVALRVFDDNGRGNLQWVEQALRWVHQHKSDFENPLTTVNLSLGVNWNGGTIPGWATLEDEFAQLEQDGIFISVAAGNAFGNYNTPGLAYPAVSDYVVPVASHGSNGLLSDFSQRNERVIVAPGESIRSTVPDHFLGNSQKGAFLSASGTSMAAPFLAGASAVVRQAMDFMGLQHISQDMIYDHFRETADQIHDAVTGGTYNRLNLGRAIDAIVNDLHSNVGSGTSLGVLNGQTSFAGTIGKLNDVDAFSFTAGSNGRVSLNVSQTHQLSSIVRVNGGSLNFTGNQASFNVVAGQVYTLSISTGDGIGHYQVGVDLKQTVTATPLGAVNSQLLRSVTVDGQQWFKVMATRDGILTTSIAGSAGLQLEIRDSSMQFLASGSYVNGILRGDATAIAGKEYFVKITGNQANVALKIDNSVSLSDGVLRVIGGDANDQVGIVESDNGQQINITIGGTIYQFASAQVRTIYVEGNAGSDNLYFRSGGSEHNITLGQGVTTATRSGLSITARNFESVHAVGNDLDTVTFLDTAGNDEFRFGNGSARMDSAGMTHIASGFGKIIANSTGGSDQSIIGGSNGADLVTSHGVVTNLQNDSTTLTTTGFAQTRIFGNGGADKLVFNARGSSDFVELAGQSGQGWLDGAFVSGDGFAEVSAFAHGSGASARIIGTIQNEYLWSSTSITRMTGANYQNSLIGFSDVSVDASAGGGSDYAQVPDSDGNDHVVANHFETHISSTGMTRRITGFDFVTVVGSGRGYDSILFSGTRGRDVFDSMGHAIDIRGARYQFRATGFDTISVSGGGGHDEASLTGTSGNDSMGFAAGEASMASTGFRVTARDFERVRFDGLAGQNIMNIRGFGQGDSLTANDQGLVAWLAQQRIEATNLIWLDASTSQDQTAIEEIGAVDFWYALHGDWE